LRKRKIDWVKNNPLNRTRLSRFILLSLGIHISFLITHMLLPVHEKIVKGPPPIQVKYFETKDPMGSKIKKNVDTPKPPVKPEKPKRDELLAKFDRRSHSNQKITPKKIYKRKKTAVPKSERAIGKTRSSRTQSKNISPEKYFLKKSHIKPRKKPLPESDIGTFKAITSEKTQKPKPSPMKKEGTLSTLALLDGLDVEQFASMDTDLLEDSDDNEPVSLDTKEIKYASYFTRIKHQIERVWIYPLTAAQRGISGDLSLTFRISKDGNLMGVRLVEQSGYEILDVAALKAVKEAAPFYPFPKNIRRDKLTILANFVYTPLLAPTNR
jgi:protein TonB